MPDILKAALEVIIEERVPVFSSGLGDPGRALTDRLHRAGIKTLVMVTNAKDARTVQASGADVIVAQGLEAGGHRSHFIKPHGGPFADLGSLSLIPDVVDAVNVPVVAAGGFVDRRGESTVVTDTITGRYAPVLNNELSAAFQQSDVEPLPFPSQAFAYTDIQAFATQTGEADYLPLYGGQRTGRLNDLARAADVVTDTIGQATQLLTRGLNERVTIHP